MKKIILVAFLFIGFLFASDFKGFIQDIDKRNKTITINNTLIQIQPYTKIEKDRCFGFDKRIQFNELKVGDLVEVDTIMYQDILMADEIELKCNRNRAY